MRACHFNSGARGERSGELFFSSHTHARTTNSPDCTQDDIEWEDESTSVTVSASVFCVGRGIHKTGESLLLLLWSDTNQPAIRVR